MSESTVSVVSSGLGSSVQAACLSGLRFMAPGTPTPHDGAVYRSRGVVLVIGDTASAVDAARELLRRAPKLRIALFAPGAGAAEDLPPGIVVVGGRIVSLQGHLGQFSASVRVAVDKVEDAGIFSANKDRHFDLVLDLCRAPLLRQAVLPYGYYAPGDDPAALVWALDSLPQLVGDFHKPKYIDYRSQLCVHGAMGVAGCRRCLDVCSTASIRSTGEKIEVNPYLCQGCASCTLACPTGALGFEQPTQQALERTLSDLLANRPADAVAHILVVHDAAARHLLPPMDASRVLLLEVNPLPAFSDLLWLSALAGGISSVVLAVAPATRNLIERKVSELRVILASLGGDPAALQIANPESVGVMIDQIKDSLHSSALTVAPINGSSPDAKRASFLARVDALGQRRQESGKAGARKPCELPAGALFGNVLIDSGKCTICLACTHLCLTGALSGQMDPMPALFFKESLCVQCDLCRAGCPEQAITLQARFLPDAVSREAARELARDELVSCSSCGTPFTGRRKLAASLTLMAEYANDLPGGIDSLRMCSNCRQRATITP